MELPERSRSPSRRTSRVEQVVGRWLRRSRDLGSRSHSLGRDRFSADGRQADSSSCDQRNYPFRFNVQIQRDPNLNSHGLTLSSQTPIVVEEVAQGGPADGRLAPGDRLVKINNVAVDDLTPEQAAEIIRECQETLSMTVLRIMLGPKSSFITPEKRAKLRSNPVKVHFAEEVEVNGHSQGNSLLFLPNVLKVYLENGQTKAFKFEPNTTVKDIVMTLKEKLSLSRIEHFSLVLEQQHSSNKLLLLHDEERILQVVQKKEVHAYRCLFRVCFMPRDLRKMLQEDATAFEYLYLQGVNDVLQERYAVEMRCNTALRLAALHIQERLVSCGQSPKANLKMITKTWGIENFVSSTLLRNMREKDLRKAIGYHMKKCQSQHDAKQKGLSVDQARINYLEELSELKFFGGKSFGATLMLQDRESMVTLLVGARYGVSQVVNHKLSITTTLTEFTSITRIELLPESDKVSLVKVYLQDIKPITLLLEAAAAKDMSCLIAGYCRVFIDPDLNVFPWIDDKRHRVSAEEGYVSRRASDTEDSSDLDMEPLLDLAPRDEKPCPRVRSSSDPDGRKKKERRRMRSTDGKEKGSKPWEDKKLKGDREKEMSSLDKNQGGENKDTVHMEEIDRKQDVGQIQPDITDIDSLVGQKQMSGGGEELRAAEEQPSVSEASDSYQTDSRVITSPSSDSLDALEEDDLISCSSHRLHLHLDRHAQPHLLAPPPAHSHPFIHLTTVNKGGGGCRRSGDGADPHFLTTASTQKCSSSRSSEDSSMCFAELSCLDDLPSPPEASEEDDDEEEELNRRIKLQEELSLKLRNASDGGSAGTRVKLRSLSPSPSSPSSHMDTVFNFDQRDTRCYYNLCSNITPDSARSLVHPREAWEEEGEEGKAEHTESIPILQPPPGFGDSSSDEEFFDARDRLNSPDDPTSGTVPRDLCTEMKLDILSRLSLSDIRVAVMDAEEEGEEGKDRKQGDKAEGGRETLFHLRKRSRKRRSYMETDYTSRVSYPGSDQESKHNLASNRLLKSLLAETSNAQLLSSEPEPSGQTHSISPTVSSFTHSEGEPAELESKPILSKPRSHGPGSLSAFEHNIESNAHSRTRKQEMEMEPDAMESKSVTDLARAPSPTITVVRCRVDPDGKESADRRCDGEEEGEEQKEMGKGKEEKKEESNSVTGSGPFTSHMFLPDSIEKRKEEEEKTERMEGVASSLKRPLVGVQMPQEENTPQVNKNDVPECSGSSLTQINTHVDESFPLSYSPPPPPPSSPLPQLPTVHKSGTGCLVKEGGNSKNMETSNKRTVINDEKQSAALNPERANHTNEAASPVTVTVTNCDEVPVVLDYSLTISDEVTDSTNSDNVFDDDDDDDDGDVANSFSHGSGDKNKASSITAKCNISEDSTTAVKDGTQIAVKPLPLSEDQTRTQSVKVDYTAINSITAKLGAVTSATSPTFNSGSCLKGEVSLPNAPCSVTNTGKPKADPTIAGAEPKGSFTSPSFMTAKTTSIYDLSKEPSPPAHFLFQTCSPTFMGRLSASTLRGKIQNLPLYLSRSQDSLNRIGDGSSAQSSAQVKPRDDTDVTIKVTDVDDVTQTLVFEAETVGESAESDDSDATLTGSELDAEFFLETTSASSVPSGSELKEVSFGMPVQTEPKPQHPSQSLYFGPVQNTPGPVTEPPASIISLLQRDMNGLQIDTPGPLKDSPKPNIKVNSSEEDIPGYKAGSQSCSIPSAIVVTTQNLNGPGLAFHGQSQRVKRTSSVRPLIGLCRPSEENSDSSKAPSAGCKIFTICEEPSETKTPAEVESAPPLKSEFACDAVLVSGCETVAESVQVPLDACGCPAVYTNCFRGEDSFDDELTVYEFSCRAQGSGLAQAAGVSLPVMTSPPVTSFLSTSSVHSPSFPHSILYSSSTSELSPLLSPLSETSDSDYVSQTHKDTISDLGQRRYPEPPAGFQVLRKDVDKLLSILESSGLDRSAKVHGGRHLRDTCPAHFTENKRVLQMEARKLMSCCQKVVGTGQSPEEMLQFLADSFRTLVELAGVCLWFSGCDRCDRRNAEAVTGLADVARSFRDFCLAAERASSKRSCQDLSTKLLAKQCTALTASVFCLTQLFRTLTAL
ncbi:FERM and PDZ domain-containing protein 1 [Cololabis saira]|uniref:FERM and PDZ domain-containing protein 1 n=1 Tax=Cololabis saira TaxID=129043 RepID=UPI002AD31C7F|nr:FERM and PDZ domain-containing protein 1 [Cololabis saira]